MDVQSQPESDDQVMREFIEFIQQRPIVWAMFERIDALARQMAKLPEHSTERVALKRRFRKLEAYIGHCIYDRPKVEQGKLVSTFAKSVQDGFIGRKGKRITSWDDQKYVIDEFRKAINKRPVGNPSSYRPKITEALEIKTFHHPEWTWARIAEHLQLDIPLEDLMRQISLLRKLLRDENILPTSTQI